MMHPLFLHFFVPLQLSFKGKLMKLVSFLMQISLKQLLVMLKRRTRAKSDETSEDSSSWAHFIRCYPNLRALKISFDEINRATDNFSPDLVIGNGRFGRLYKGTLSNGVHVAVKRHNPEVGIREFRTEIMVLSQIRHPNILSLKGYCDERSEMLLVYEYVDNGTLKDHLHLSYPLFFEISLSQTVLSWEQRLQICIDSAEALHYLHSGRDRRIIHRDVKPSKIWLDKNYAVKVAGFGLSISVPSNKYECKSSRISGTIGYMAPEYMRKGLLTEKSDVYSFGVVLIEVLCARPIYMIKTDEVEEEWRNGNLGTIIDADLVGSIGPCSLRIFIETAEKCLRENRDERPGMREVLWNLEFALELQQGSGLQRDLHEDSMMANACLDLLIKAVYGYPSGSSDEEEDPPSGPDEDAMFTEVFSPIHNGR